LGEERKGKTGAPLKELKFVGSRRKRTNGVGRAKHTARGREPKKKE